MPIVKVNDVSLGVNLDLTPEELQIGAWSSAQNMRFLNGYAQRFKGTARVFDAPTVTPYWIQNYITPTKRYWVHAGLQKVFADDGVTRTDLTKLSTVAISTITYATTTATLTTSAAHGLTTGNSVTIWGAYPSNYNGTFTITVTGATTFTYVMTSAPTSNASPVGYLITPSSTASNFTGAIDDRWSGGSIGGILVVSNGVDSPCYWDGDASTKLREIPGWNSAWTCKVIKPFKNYLIALDVTKSGSRKGSMVKWSAASVSGALPISWDENDVTKDAGESTLSETPDNLVDALPLGDALIIYKERSCYAMRYIGTPFVFQFTRIPGDYGMLYRGCAVDTPVGHVVMTAGDIVVNTGQVMTSIADGAIRRYIFNNINTSNYKRAFVTSNPQRNEVLVCFPFGDSATCNKAAVWNWDTKKWGIRDLTNVTYGATGLIDNVYTGTWASDSETWELDATTWNENEYSPNEARLLFSETSRISAFDVSAGDDGATNLTGYLERTGMTFDDPATVKMIRAVYPRIEAPSGTQVTVEIGGSMFPNVPPTWVTCSTYTVGQSIKADGFAVGKFLAIRITASRPWRMRSFDLDIVPQGAY